MCFSLWKCFQRLIFIAVKVYAGCSLGNGLFVFLRRRRFRWLLAPLMFCFFTAVCHSRSCCRWSAPQSALILAQGTNWTQEPAQASNMAACVLARMKDGRADLTPSSLSWNWIPLCKISLTSLTSLSGFTLLVLFQALSIQPVLEQYVCVPLSTFYQI